MIKTADIVRAIDMSRVERNEPFYRMNEADQDQRVVRIAGRFLSAIGIILMVIVVAACLCLVIPRIAGYESYVVVSGSMEPAIPVGSVVYSEETEPALLKTGDVIVFIDAARGSTPITHRVVSNNTNTGTVITKGDANTKEDANPVTYGNILGKVKAHIPRIGFTVAMFSTVLGKLVAALIMLESWLLIEIGGRLVKRTRRAARSQS